MRVSDIIQNEGAVLIRPRKTDHIQGQPFEYDVKDYFSGGQKRGWVALDQFTKSAMKSVYDALSKTNQAKFDFIPIFKLVDFTWKIVK